MTERLTILEGDCIEVLRGLPDTSVHCCVTSPPYWGLRDYGVDGQIGLEKTPEEYVAKMVAVFREVKRVLRDDGTLWLNLGDSYAGGAGRWGKMPEGCKQTTNEGSTYQQQAIPEGLKPKDLVGIPWRVAFALQADGWYLRSDIIWHKPNPMPESVTDRPTKSHEYIFMLSKQSRYYYDSEAVKESLTDETVADLDRNGGERGKRERNVGGRSDGYTSARGTVGNLSGRNKRTVWTVPSQPYPESHFATFPEALIKPCILAGTSARGCCPKCGAPWERVVETNNPSKSANTGMDMTGGAAKTGNPQTSDGLHRNGGGVYSSSQTIGWQPTCECGCENTVPCVVCDPFGGSGTTGKVALELGRKAILIELNPKYVELMKRRTDVTPGLALA